MARAALGHWVHCAAGKEVALISSAGRGLHRRFVSADLFVDLCDYYVCAQNPCVHRE